MVAYYNEVDKNAASWLRELIARGCIAEGDVDERSIEDVVPDDLMGYTQCHFFAGIGGWSLALRKAGWPDGEPVWTGSCPCQPFSSAGKGKGFADERHLWPAFHWLIAECRPPVVFGEQVAQKAGIAWFDLVQTDLEREDYTCGMAVFPACGVGAPHLRQRMYWVADTERARLEGFSRHGVGSGQPGRHDTYPTGPVTEGGPVGGFWGDAEWLYCRDGRARPVEPGTFPLAYGVPCRVGRLRGYGNAVVVPQAQAFVESYMDCDRRQQ